MHKAEGFLAKVVLQLILMSIYFNAVLLEYSLYIDVLRNEYKKVSGLPRNITSSALSTVVYI